MARQRKCGQLAAVSVVIPCYRCRDTIERAVTSVAAQAWRPAELILVDDASDDDTPEILRTLQERYGADWIKIVSLTRNSGPAVARNAGWDVATQPYVAFLDADDAWHPRKIEIQAKYMLAHPEIAISGHRSYWLREGKAMPSLPKHYTIKSISQWQMLVSNRLATRTVMLRKDMDLRFELAKWHTEDYLLWLEIICSGHKGAFIDLDLAYSYKASYGTGGLSGQLWKMEKGELDTYRRLRDKRLISWPAFVGLSVWSLVKYARRVVVGKLRTMKDEA